jgi:hypothetical protein
MIARRVRRIWTKNIVGPVAVCAILLPIAGGSFHVSLTVTVCLGAAPLLIAILLTWPAHHEVWRQERAEREKEISEERAKREAAEVSNGRPEIQGELNSFRLSFSTIS